MKRRLKDLIDDLATDLWTDLRFKDGDLSGFVAWMLLAMTASNAALLILDKFFHQLPSP